MKIYNINIKNIKVDDLDHFFETIDYFINFIIKLDKSTKKTVYYIQYKCTVKVDCFRFVQDRNFQSRLGIGGRWGEG